MQFNFKFEMNIDSFLENKDKSNSRETNIRNGIQKLLRFLERAFLLLEHEQ